jgi:uncharacterized Zn finger protein
MAEEQEPRKRRRRSRRRSKGGQGKAKASENGGGSADEGTTKQAASAERAENGGGESRGRRGRGRGRTRSRPRGKKKATRGRARPRRGRVHENWWARRWIEVLESFAVGRRLGRGRSYARQGQVNELELDKGQVTALVQGSRDAPYLVRMHFSMLSTTDWKKMTRALAEDDEIATALVSGHIPENIEEAFEPLGLSLFPATSGDLKTACSCPDQANPCKHVAAVYYLLGEEFDRDPFLIFRLRGIDREELIEAIGGRAALAGAPVPAPEPPPPPRKPAEADGEGDFDEDEPMAARSEPRPEPEPPAPLEPEPLPTDVHAFWAGESPPDATLSEIRIPQLHAALARRLGGFSFWRGRDECETIFERAYRNASISGLDVYLGDTGDAESD